VKYGYNTKKTIGEFKRVFSTTKLTVTFELKLDESHDPCLMYVAPQFMLIMFHLPSHKEK